MLFNFLNIYYTKEHKYFQFFSFLIGDESYSLFKIGNDCGYLYFDFFFLRTPIEKIQNYIKYEFEE